MFFFAVPPRAVTQSRGRIATAKRARSHLQEIGHGYNVRGADDFEAENQVILKNRITAAALQKGFDELPGDPPLNGVTKSLALGAGVIRGFLGNVWFDRHILPEGKKGFLTIDESTPERREETFFRVIDLAEVLYNLQYTPGFDECIERMRKGDVEGTYAELDLGRMLFLNRVPFQYVVPQGVKKLDYDVEILYSDGRIACADAKCKIENTALSENTIINTLKAARKQLPNDRPGIIFIKIPPHWMSITDYDKTLIETAKRYLRDTKRIVSIKYYVSPLTFGGGYMKHQHAYKEISNLSTIFGDMLDWNVFQTMDLPPEANGMPPWWQRVLFYPDGKQR
jgi:hypothetical protein